jgi:hypothetical protein
MEARMTVKTTLSFTDRHHQFLSEKVVSQHADQGVHSDRRPDPDTRQFQM